MDWGWGAGEWAGEEVVEFGMFVSVCFWVFVLGGRDDEADAGGGVDWVDGAEIWGGECAGGRGGED